jgi:hypothetical protein
LVDDRVLRVSPVLHIASKPRVGTKILAAPPAKPANPIDLSQPRYADPIVHGESLDILAPFDYTAYDLMARNDRHFDRREVAFHYMQVRPAHTTRFHPHEDFAGARLGLRNFLHLERPACDGGLLV